MEKRYVVGVDLGTTSVKTAVYDFEGVNLGSGQEMNPLTYPGVGRVECDGPKLIECVYKSCREAIENSGVDPNAIAAVSFDMFRCTMVTRDKDGGFTTPIIIWQDLRGAEMMPEMEKMLAAHGMTTDDLYDMCGMPLGGVNPSTKLQWVKKFEPDAYKNATRIHTMMGFLVKAFGADDYYDDITDTPWLQLNGEDLNYSEKLCDVFDVDMDKLAPLKNPGEVIGEVTPEVAEKTGLAVGTPLIMGTGDQQIGCLGNGCIPEGIGYYCGGTAGIAAGKSDHFLRDPNRRCYVLGTPDGGYVMEGQANAAGSAFKWFRTEICKSETAAADSIGVSVYDLLTRGAQKSEPGSKGLFFLPYLQGSNSPNYEANARGSIVGMTFGHSRCDIVRSLMEGICFEGKDMLEAMIDGNVPSYDVIRLSGGIARSQFWCQMQADIYNLPCETVAEEEATALGCAMMAAYGAGIYKSFQEAADHMVHVTRRYEPNAENVKRYEDAYHTWHEIYHALSGKGFDAVKDFQEKYR
jgi:xylulokinase